MTNVAQALTIDNDTGRSRAMRPVGGNAVTPMDMLNQAIQSGANMDTLEKLLALQERWEAGQARKAFDAALAAAKAEIPVIGKNAKGHGDKRYANFAAYVEVVTPILAAHGLSFRFKAEQGDRITVTCIISHRDGHSEENKLHGPADKTGSKNDIQAIGSTLTYLQRYSLIQALGLAAAEDDDGAAAGKGDDGGPITADQAATLRKLIDETGADIVKFCEWAKIEAVPDLLARHYDKAVNVLQQRRKPS